MITTVCEDILYIRPFLEPDFADAQRDHLMQSLALAPETLRIMGRSVLTPRLVGFYGEPGVSYRYSGTAHQAQPWPPALVGLAQLIERAIGWQANCVLCNLYRDGSDAMGWHSDDERDLGPNPVIASLSLGATRRLRIRPRSGGRESMALDLEHGSLLLMTGRSQSRWQHALMRTRRPVGPRLNLTFRRVEN